MKKKLRKAEKCFLKSRKSKFFKKYYTNMLRIVFACDIPATVEVGEGFELIHNGLGVVIHPRAKFGKNCKVYQNVTIGGNGKIIDGVTQVGAPIIEDNVAIFAGACVLGPIRIGHDSYIGANAVVTKDVPPNSLVYGNPAVITERKFAYDFGDGDVSPQVEEIKDEKTER